MDNTILFFPRSASNETLTASKMNEIASALGFNLQTCDVGVTVAQARSFIEFWKPIGCIINNDTLPPCVFRGIPSAFCHRDPKTMPPRSVLFSFDENAIAQMAAHELLQHNHASYCFVPDISNEYWCLQRKQGFIRAMEINFKLKCTSVCPISGRSLPHMQTSIAKHLLTLPKPIGVFAANDRVARVVADACLHDNLHIPNDVSILGVDNNIKYCERPDISISSIGFAKNAESESMVHALTGILSSQQRKTKIVRIAPIGIVRRASTIRFSRTDHHVQDAVELIRRQACNGLSANEVAKLFNCSRRMAEARFRAVTGHTMLDEILDVRLNKARELLAAGNLKAPEIAARCGYRAWSSVFRLLGSRKARIHPSQNQTR